ncbi:NACHT domain-containing protein [Streptomyces sp. MBT65]|uniref:NACHT domain-containing protein n=1 Tax=Streptomyces sp. MBT65 TaxID=1488395 RepID=UPI00190DE498|nr:NACHT domain-containing protein [Streptomyces sp. MBT65]MBK3576290.1 NACHT domain-containing protein [Streptomyces sp. MBT65]
MIGAGLLIAAALMVAALYLVAVRRRARAVPTTAAETDHALNVLAAEVRAMWQKESVPRGVERKPTQPRLLDTQWSAVSRNLADSSAPQFMGSTADMSGLSSAFREMDAQRLVVIGPAGSGKSMLLVLLLLELCAHHTPSSPVPVIFSMSSYDPHRHDLTDWLTERLTSDYGVGRPALVRLLLEQGRVLPLLDGLDEIPGRHRVAALDRIRGTFHEGRPVVVACRTSEYEQALRSGPVLDGAAVTEARPLAFRHVLTYLRRSLEQGPYHADWERLFDQMDHGWGVLEDEIAEAADSGVVTEWTWSTLVAGSSPHEAGTARGALWARWSAQVTAVGAPGGADEVSPRLLAALGDALTSPLMAVLFTDLFRYAVAEDDKMFRRLAASRPEDIKRAILDAAVHMMFHRRLPAGPWSEAKRYLVFLARHLSATDRTDLAWWELSKAIPPWCYGILLALLLGTAGGLTTTFAVNGRTGIEAAAELTFSGFVTGTLLSWLGPDRTASLLDREAAGTPRFSRLSTALAVGVPMTLATALPLVPVNGPAAALLAGGLLGVLFGGVAGLLGAGGPVRGPRWLRRGTGFWIRIRGGATTGALAGAALGLLFWVALLALTARGSANWSRVHTPLYGFSSALLGLLIGLGLGGLSGVLGWMQAPAPADDPTSPRSLLAGDRRLVIGWGLVVAVLPAALMVVAMPASTVVEGVVLVGVMALWVPIAVRTWPRYVIARLLLAVRGELPWRLIPFLVHAHGVSALRQVGGIYQFRHKDLQEHLSKEGVRTGAP